MPTIVNSSFFVEPIELPNLTNAATLETLNIQIAKYEPECLLKILGYPLYKKFGDEASPRMTDLLVGAEYIDGRGDLQKWQGLKHDTNISLIASYIYFFVKKNAAARTSDMGTVITKPESGVNISPAEKMTEAWNFFSSEVLSMCCFLWLKKVNGQRVYPEFTYHQYCETRRVSRPIDPIFEF